MTSGSGRVTPFVSHFFCIGSGKAHARIKLFTALLKIMELLVRQSYGSTEVTWKLESIQSGTRGIISGTKIKMFTVSVQLGSTKPFV